MSKGMTFHYTVYFEFTTIHRGGKFIGRSGQLGLDSNFTLEKIKRDLDTVKKLCIQFVHDEKQKRDIFMLDVKTITEIK